VDRLLTRIGEIALNVVMAMGALVLIAILYVWNPDPPS
jgi:hypothetical protein